MFGQQAIVMTILGENIVIPTNQPVKPLYYPSYFTWSWRNSTRINAVIFVGSHTNTQIYKRSLWNDSHQMVSFVYSLFFGGFVGAWATQMHKCANTQIAVPAQLIGAQILGFSH